jgi:16S rRNA processing protein RimM
MCIVMNPLLYTIGTIVNTHGIKGELKVISDTDFPERFQKGNTLQIVTKQNLNLQVVIEQSRDHKNMVVLKLAGYDSINEVEIFKGCLLKIQASDQKPLPDGQYYYHQILGCEVETREQIQLGIVSEILSPGANDVWVVRKPGSKDILIPVIDDVIVKVDPEHKRIQINLMEGLLEL